MASSKIPFAASMDRARRVAYAHETIQCTSLGSRSRFGKRQRHETFEWIKCRSNATMQQMKKLIVAALTLHGVTLRNPGFAARD